MGSAAPDIRRIAARCALGVPGVARLHPGPVRRAEAATGAGVRAERTGAAGWSVEVRCVLCGEYRALDTARRIRVRVRAAVAGHLAGLGTPEPVTVRVTVTDVRPPGPVA